MNPLCQVAEQSTPGAQLGRTTGRMPWAAPHAGSTGQRHWAQGLVRRGPKSLPLSGHNQGASALVEVTPASTPPADDPANDYPLRGVNVASPTHRLPACRPRSSSATARDHGNTIWLVDTTFTTISSSFGFINIKKIVLNSTTVRAFNKTCSLLTDLKVYRTVLLPVGTRFYSRSLEFINRV